MKFSTPKFWYEKTSEKPFGLLLSPLGMVYGFFARQRFDLYHPIPLSKPVVCVGNLVAGGAGKTPVVMSIVRALQEKGYNPHILSRGYGGQEKGPLQVSPNRDTVEDVGDEPLLLVDVAPTWVSANRPLGAQSAIDTGANVVVMDDGFQNPSMYKDFALLVIDGAVGFGNGRIFPAGPLRERPEFGLSRADAVVIVGEDKAGTAAYIASRSSVPVYKAVLKPRADNPDLAGKTVFAFAGIGRPEKFRQSLLDAGAVIEGWGSYPDHFNYVEEDLRELIAAAEAKDAVIVTTAKDYVRLPERLRSKITVFAVDIEWQNLDGLMLQIEAVLNKVNVWPSS